MCESKRKLIAWLDGELASDEAAGVERHLQVCAECRARLESYRQASAAFDFYCDKYCDAITAARSSRKLSPRALAVSGAAVAAAVVALLLLAPRAPLRLSPAPGPAPTPGSSTSVASQPARPVHAIQAPEAPAPPITSLSRVERSRGKGAEQIRQATSQPQGRELSEFPAAAAVEIAIPGDAIFPPGAVPEGMSFTADVTIAPDGSAQQIRLRPQFVEFERRSTQP